MYKYKDIINLPCYVSKKYPRMSIFERSAQFAPFEALTGHEEAVEETVKSRTDSIKQDENSYNFFHINIDKA